MNNCYQIEVEGSGENKLNVSRKIEVGEYGLVQVTDFFMIDNTNGTSPIEFFSFGFPEDFSHNVEYIKITDNQDRNLPVRSSINNTSKIEWFEVTFPEPILAGADSSFNITILLSKVLEYESNAFIFGFPIHPILSTKAENSNTIIILPKGAVPNLPSNSTVKGALIDDRRVLNETISPLEPNDVHLFSFNYSSDVQKIMECKSIEKRIVFKSNGEILISDNYSLSNLGGTISSINVPILENVEDTMLYDNLGFIGLVQAESEQGIVTVSPRYHNVRGGENLNFQLKYKIQQKNYIKQLDWWGRYGFSIPIQPNEDLIIEKYKIIFELPSDAIIEDISPEASASINPTTSSQSIIEYNFEPMNPLGLAIEIELIYKYQIFWASVKPMEMLLMLEVLVAILLIAYTLKKPSKSVTKIPLESLRKFVDLQDEKNESRHELEKQDEELIRGRISRREYQRRKRMIGIRLSELNRTMFQVKNELRKVHARYADIILTIEKSESEIGALRMNKFQIRSQYRSGRIIKEAYESLVSDIDRKINKAEETLEALLIMLREEAR